MFNFSLGQSPEIPPIVVLMACPVCTRCRVEHTGVSIRYQQPVLCDAHRDYLERLLRDYTVPRLAITCFLNLIRKKA